MELIMYMAKDIKSEIHDAEKYIERAIHCKVKYPKIAEMYKDLARKELSDAQEIHKHITMVIEEVKKTMEPPEYMLKMWNEEHVEIIERFTKIKYALDMLHI